jgi:hypothetical protein
MQGATVPEARERVEQEARAAAQRFASLNDACPYPFGTEAARIFSDAFAAARAALEATPGLQP